MEYANPDALVSTAWVADHLDEPNVRILEVNEDVQLFASGHVPGAQRIDWLNDLWDDPRREFISPERVASLFERLGVSDDTTVVLYGDKNNWWAAYAFWFFTYSGHERLKLMNGGRIKWLAEGRPTTTEAREPPPGAYTPKRRDDRLRAFKDDVARSLDAVAAGRAALVDVRSPAEFAGDTTHMPEYPQEGVLRGGHIPGAQSIPWAQAANEDGTFKSAPQLAELYAGKGVTADKDVITYCRIAERSSHTWFVLTQLLGYPSVRSYDGSRTEWGNAVGMPIAKGS